ncbi:hypothetical protein BBP40_004544 [Aspergillus hancockii]|nr:hypothetical protein BBP40_004544 [Aspergillus hancockii]
MKLGTILLLASSALFTTVAAQRQCYYIQRYGRPQHCDRCRSGYVFEQRQGCNPYERCCRGRCCRRFDSEEQPETTPMAEMGGVEAIEDMLREE